MTDVDQPLPCSLLPLGMSSVRVSQARRMQCFEYETLGETWINLVRATLECGVDVNGEGPELIGVQVSFPASDQNDPLVTQCGDNQLVAEMEKVFFSDAPNSLGHSYSRLMSGPAGRRDLQDIVDLLRARPASKRAVVTICGPGDGNVPCVNAVQFLCRRERLQIVYFARGQDAFRKFYADGLCVAKMARRVASALNLPVGKVEGFIGSSHLYHRDRPAIDRFLSEGRAFLRKGNANGGE